MSNTNWDEDWVLVAPQDGLHIRRAEFTAWELRDFERDVMLQFTSGESQYRFALTLREAQKVFHALSTVRGVGKDA